MRIRRYSRKPVAPVIHMVKTTSPEDYYANADPNGICLDCGCVTRMHVLLVGKKGIIATECASCNCCGGWDDGWDSGTSPKKV